MPDGEDPSRPVVGGGGVLLLPLLIRVRCVASAASPKPSRWPPRLRAGQEAVGSLAAGYFARLGPTILLRRRGRRRL
jgi:hypothetical protein